MVTSVQMASAENRELLDAFEEFYRTYYRDEVGELAREYPGERKSLYVDWSDLYRYDTDIADDYLSQPEQMQEYAEEALRLYDLPIDVSLGQAHVRVQNLPEVTEIRALRSRHVNRLVSVQGIVRKATGVRPKITEAAFECQRCGTLTRIPQAGGDFREPHECQGCERQGPFRINHDQSEFIDAQKLQVQESPEGLRGGETPEGIAVNVEDDLTGRVSPGDHVTVTGVLHLEQQGSEREKSTMFDVYMEGVSVVVEDEEFEEMDISDEDEERIKDLAEEDDIYEQMVGSIAPSIYGYEEEKQAIVLQLFSGVTKHLPDGSRTRGDFHILLIGDPGTGKCVSGDTRVTLSDGSEVPIREVVERNLDDPKPVDDGVYDHVDLEVPSLAGDGTLEHRRATKVWKREAPDRLYRIRTASGREIEVTPSHPLYVQSDGQLAPVKAEELREGEFVATPRRIQTEWDNSIEVDYRRSRAPNAVRLKLPDEWTRWLARLVGYVVAEGYVNKRGDGYGYLSLTNEDREVLDDVEDALERLGLNYAENEPREGKSAREIRCAAGELVSFLENLEPALCKPSAEQRVPDALLRAGPDIKTAFLQAYVEGEGHVSEKEREITVASMSRELLEGVRSLLLSLGIPSQLQPRNNGSFRLRISGDAFGAYVERIGFRTARKTETAEGYHHTDGNTNRDVVPGLDEELVRIRSALGLSQFDCGIPRSTYQHYERGDRNPSRESLSKVVAAFEARLDWLRETRERVADDRWEAIETARDELGISQKALADGMAVTQGAVSYYEQNDVVPDGGHVADASAVVLDRIDEGLAVEEDVRALRALAGSDVRWDAIESVEPVEPDDEWVYDLEVDGTHNYLTNNVVSHNSALLQYIRNIAPRSVYTSGKGSSAAGLTAAAVRDDFAEGNQWTLEAGALVLADRGVAAVDELDKMDPNDRSAMHEALESQTISISKAGINATLKSRCSLLAAANPKYGRFDQYEPIAEQIELEPALISRFDLIFTVTDQPDAEQDRELAEHILETNYAGELNTQRNEAAADVSEETVAGARERAEPAIDPELLRKYVAYAKRTVYPTLSSEAREAIREFYVDLRAQGADEDAPVPVTARKLEALVRLAEASARVRLSDAVTRDDAERVIALVRSSLENIGVDPETGEFDADVIETGTSKSQRDRIRTVLGIIKDLEDEHDEGAPVEEVKERAEEIGIEESNVEHEVEKLRQKGDIYEPSQGHLRST